MIRRATKATRLAAAERLVGAGRGDPTAGRRFLEAARAHSIDISELWYCERSAGGPEGGVGAVCLVVPGSGRSGMVFTSTPRNDAEELELTEVVTRACRGTPGIRLAQALLEPEERRVRSALERGGFLYVGDLAYLRRPTPGPGEFRAGLTAEGWGEGVSVRRYCSADEERMVELLERTYEETLDCPELCGLRDTRDVLESHRQTGRFDGGLWWVLEIGGAPEGVMLLNPCPDHDSIELVYLGLTRRARGRGLGRRLMELGLGLVAGRPERQVTCAVDERNTPAAKLYESLGFERFARRTALVLALGQEARRA